MFPGDYYEMRKVNRGLQGLKNPEPRKITLYPSSHQGILSGKRSPGEFENNLLRNVSHKNVDRERRETAHYE